MATAKNYMTVNGCAMNRIAWEDNLNRIALNAQSYADLFRACTERYRTRLVQADPRLEPDMAFHLTHNCGNAEARIVLDRYRAVSSYISRRRSREYDRLSAAYRVEG